MHIYGSALVTWRITERDATSGDILSESEGTNLIVNSGRTQMFKNLFALPGSSGFIAMCVGASSTAAQVTDTGMTCELIYSLRKPLTNTNNVALSSADITNETTTISGTTYQQKVICQANWTAGDANNGNIFAEYGLNTTAQTPGTPFTVSGVLLNHFIDPAPVTKTSSNTIAAQMTIRF